MKMTKTLLPMAALILVTAPALAEKTEPDVSIAFANRGGVRDWMAGQDNRTVFIQDRARNWYRATLVAPVPELPFVQAISVDTSGFGKLNKWGAIEVRGIRYPIETFEKIEGRPPREER